MDMVLKQNQLIFEDLFNKILNCQSSFNKKKQYVMKYWNEKNLKQLVMNMIAGTTKKYILDHCLYQHNLRTWKCGGINLSIPYERLTPKTCTRAV